MVGVRRGAAGFVLVVACGPSEAEPCLATEWAQTLTDAQGFCGFGVLPDGEIGVYVNGPDGPSLRVYDADGVLLGVRTVPTFGERPTCLSIAADPAGGWWLTVAQDQPSGFERSSSLHRLPHREAVFTSTSTAVPEGGLLNAVVAIPGGVMIGGGRARPDVPTWEAISITLDDNLDEEGRRVEEDLGQFVHLESLGDMTVALAKVPSEDYGDAVMLGFEDPGGPPTWTRDAGTLGDDHDAILSFATTQQGVLLLKTSLEVVPGSDPFVPGDLSTLPPLQSRSVVEAWSADGEIVWAHDVVDDVVDLGHVAGDDSVILAWRGVLVTPPWPERLELSAFEVLSLDGECTCAFESPIAGQILDIAPLHGAPAGSFVVVSQVDQTFALTRVSVSPR